MSEALVSYIAGEASLNFNAEHGAFLILSVVILILAILNKG